MRLLLRPLGHLAFLASVLALGCCRWMLGDEDELGFFAGRLSGTINRYPEVTRRGVQLAWVMWAGLFAVAVSPLDPLATQWDEVALAPVPVLALWRRLSASRSVSR